MNARIFLFSFLLCIPSLVMKAHEITLEPLSKNTYSLSLACNTPQGDGYYHDYFAFATDNPDVTLSEWNSSVEPSNVYDATFKTNKKIYNESCSISMDLQGSYDTIAQSHLLVTSYQKSNNSITQESFSLARLLPHDGELFQANEEELSKTTSNDIQIADEEKPPSQSWSHGLSSMMETTNSSLLRIIISLLLGLLLSLTPCIYPMIPITIGILQAQGSSSMGRNFLLALMYTLGIATTFSLLGLAAAFAGKMVGSIMTNPIVIIAIVAILLYLAGSMLGLYNMYTPQFMQPSNTSTKGGSLFSAFAIGAISGTIASPCLSPGLLLLLSIVSSLGNIFLGFCMLFAFGFGLGIPLLIIGTFSGSLNMLPRAGMWMVEVKQCFGLVIIGTCFYFLQGIMPWYIITWLIAGFLFFCGVFFLHTAHQPATQTGKLIKKAIGVLFIISSVYGLFHAYKTTHGLPTTIGSQSPTSLIAWMDNFDTALLQSQEQHKPMLLKIGAPYCSICKAIDRKHFGNQKVQENIAANLIAVRIDDIEENVTTLALKDKFKVMGAPTIILYDPTADAELCRWGSELYDASNDECIAQINRYIQT